MGKTIVLNSTHWNKSQKKFIYNFPSNQNFKNSKVALQGLSIYNSFFNIATTYNNRKITYNFLGTDYDVNLDAGNYSVSDLNYALQQAMYLNKHHLLNANGKAVYYLEFQTNAVIYAVQINTYAVPTSAQATSLGYTKPIGATWNFPSSATCPTITLSEGFGKLIGYEAGTYGSGLSVDTQLKSSKSPEVAVVNSLVLCCNMVSNAGFSNPDNVFYSCPLNAKYGDQINIAPFLVFNDIKKGQYSTVEVSFLDQNNNQINIYDYDVLITLYIEDN